MGLNRAFKIKVGDKLYDYRLGKDLDLDAVRNFFSRRYKILKLWSGGRHILGHIEKGGKKLFLKLATSVGISAVTKVEYDWNLEFNKCLPRKICNFWVPKNFESGRYKNNLFYLVSERLDGTLIVDLSHGLQISKDFVENIDNFIEFSEIIQTLTIGNLRRPDVISAKGYREWFVEKTKFWYGDIPEDIVKRYNLSELLSLVEIGVKKLGQRPRHGDFTPWHIFKLKSGRFGLIDGEHAMANSVENYDIAYFIQRVFSVLKSPDLALKILKKLIKRGYNVEVLRTILAARAIGGFLDETQAGKPNYDYARSFKGWVFEI